MSFVMEPNLVTDPALVGILDEPVRREPIFHSPEWGTTRADFERMTLPDFWEIGASGHRYSRDYVLAELEKCYQSHSIDGQSIDGQSVDTWEATDSHCRRLAEDVFLLTYTLFQAQRKTRRSTIWQRTQTGWKIVFHQRAIVQNS